MGKAAIRGVRRAADRFLAARARWTSAKLVVQQPKESTNPSPNPIDSQLAPIGLVTLPTPVPSQGAGPAAPGPWPG